MTGTCSSCRKQKNALHAKQSALLPGINIFMCQSCIDLEHEPRWTIILAGRNGGFARISEYIIAKRYTGKPILAEEIISR
jgi:hypothetical protein